jgi:single-strand DNA-binding protein
MGVNKAILVGNVGKDPVIQYIKEDLPVARFTLATSETYRDKNGEKVTNTEWHNITAWRGLAKLVEQYIKKGTQLYIEGKISTRSYEKDGITRYMTEIVASTIQFVGRAESGNSTGASSGTSSSAKKDEDLPPVTSYNEPLEQDNEFAEGDDLPF